MCTCTVVACVILLITLTTCAWDICVLAEFFCVYTVRSLVFSSEISLNFLKSKVEMAIFR